MLLFHLVRFHACSSSIQYEITWVKTNVKVGPLSLAGVLQRAMAGAPSSRLVCLPAFR